MPGTTTDVEKMEKRPRLPLAGLSLALVLAGGLSAPEAVAQTDRDNFTRMERESRLRAIEDSRIELRREKWRQRARERDAIRHQRVPAVRSVPAPTDRLSGKLHPVIEPLGNVERRFENSADVQRRATAPSLNRVRPKSLEAFERRHSR